MISRLQLTYDEIIDILDVKYISGSTIGCTLPPGVYKISDINLMLKSSPPGKVKINITIDDNRLKSNLNYNKTIRFTQKFFYTTLGFMESQWGVLGDVPGFI